MNNKIPAGMNLILYYIGWITVSEAWRIFFRDDSIDNLILEHNNLLWLGYLLSLIIIVSSIFFILAVMKRKKYGLKTFYVSVISSITSMVLVGVLIYQNTDFAREAYILSRTNRGLSTEFVESAINPTSTIVFSAMFSLFYLFLAYYVRKHRDFFESSNNDRNITSVTE